MNVNSDKSSYWQINWYELKTGLIQCLFTKTVQCDLAYLFDCLTTVEVKIQHYWNPHCVRVTVNIQMWVQMRLTSLTLTKRSANMFTLARWEICQTF